MSDSPSKLPDTDYPDDDLGSDSKAGQNAEKLRRMALEVLARWHWMVFFAILGSLGAAYYLSKAPKLYRSASTLLIKDQTSSVMRQDQVEEIDLRSAQGLQTVAERIRRFDLLERVASRQDVRELPGLTPPAVDWLPTFVRARMPGGIPEVTETRAAPAPPALAGMIGGWLQVSIRQGTRLIDISITHNVPEVSKALADAVAREYLAEITNAKTQGRSSSIELLKTESEQARVKLQVARGAMASYGRTLEVHRQLDAKELEVAALLRRYLPKHPKMIAANAELASLKQSFVQEFDAVRNGSGDKAYWETAGKLLPDPEVEAEAFVRTARQQLLSRIGVLESEIQSSTTVFNSMLTRIDETSVNQESDETSAEVSSLARVPGPPSSPNSSLILGIGSAGGFGVGLLFALVAVRMDNRFNTVSQAAGETGMNILAAVADINTSHLKVAERQHLKHYPDADLAPFEKWDQRLVFRPGASSTSYAEMFRVLRASVSLLGDETQRKITLFSSALPGEGKTSISSNFALAAAGQGRRTLLIDLDLRKPSIHKTFGLAREQEKGGITECLANQAKFEDVIIRETGHENLHVIVGGRRAPNPGELLNTSRLKALFNLAREHYDVIVLDTAPLLAVPDTRMVCPLADNNCLVVRADYVPKGAVARVLTVLEEDGTKLSGLVFNGFKERRRFIGENYSYGYYSTSRYGRAYRYGYSYYGSSYGSEDEEGKPEKKRGKRGKSKR
jgi:succinoglycan biosynthesis transport protein ExoP